MEENTTKIIDDFQRGICGGHQNWRATTYNILIVGYYWPTLFQETNAKVRSFPECQLFVGRQKLKPLLLRLVRVETPFQ